MLTAKVFANIPTILNMATRKIVVSKSKRIKTNLSKVHALAVSKRTPAKKSSNGRSSRVQALAVTKKSSAKKTPTKKNTTVKIEPSEMVESSVSGPRRIMVSRKWLYLLLGLVVLGGAFYLGSKYLIVAWVDQKPVTLVEYYNNLNSKYGKDTREQMIAERLIVNEAQKRGVNATEQEIDAQVKKFETERGGADQLNQLLTMQGLSRPEFLNLVKLQLLREKMFSNNVQVTDEEVNKYLEDNKDQFPTVDDTTKTSVKEQLKQNKINTAFTTWLDGAMQSDRVKRS